jgi:hypothetical protein
MTRSFILSLVTGLVLMLAPPQPDLRAQQTEPKNLKLLWAFGAVVGAPDHRELVSITKDTVLHTGDQLKIYFESHTPCHVYLIYQSSQGHLTLLFPGDGTDSKVHPGSEFYIPEGELWFQLDAITGPEKFYLIASVNRLNEFENLYRSMTANATDTVTRKESVQSVLAAIERLKRRNRKLTAAAERPVRLGGNFRGTEQKSLPADRHDITQLAVEIEADEFYSRTFSIDHR